MALSMKKIVMLAALLICRPAEAIVGGAAPAAEGVGRSVVTIVGSRGNFCSGALIAARLVLTAAHCVQPDATYKIVEYDADRRPLLRDVDRVAVDPAFDIKAILAHRASADVALLRLASPLREPHPAIIGVPRPDLLPGQSFTIAGIGVTVRGEGASAGTVRAAALVTAGQPGALQIRLLDPAGQGIRAGLGACTGDSGGPVFQDQQDVAVIIGVISWSTGANAGAGCGGMTGVTPLTLYRDWILQTATRWGAAP
jgi:hypothetical protein